MKHLDELLTFLTVANLKSFSKAARALNMPTTTISRKINALEEELGAKLFERTTRSLSITEVGRSILPKAELVSKTILELKEDVESHSGVPSGSLKITIPATKIQQLAPLFAEFLSLYPDVRITFDCSSRNKDVIAQGYDFAFRYGPLSNSSLIAIPLSRMKYVAVANKTLIAKKPKLNHPSDLAYWPCIRNHIDGLELLWNFVYDGNPYALDTKAKILSDDILASRQLALNGVGVAYLPNTVVQEQIDQGQLIDLCPTWMPIGRDLYLMHADKKLLPPKSTAFIRFIRENRKRLQSLLFHCSD